MLPGLGLALALVLAGGPGAASDARRELEACAARIEELKALPPALRGELTRRELERLLVRAQELALELERSRQEVPPAAASPSPEELRELADAARDEADRLSAEIAELDVKLGDARRLAHAEGDPTVARATLGSPGGAAQADRVRELSARRAALARRRALAENAAARYEAEARAADADR